MTLHNQTTLRETIRFEGVGLHTGVQARVVVHPAPAGSGLAFRLGDAVTVPAHAEYVVDTRRATVIGEGAASVSTVEHLLSALAGMGIDNALIEVHGPEIPVMDGSAREFSAAIAQAGTTVFDEPRRTFAPAEPAYFREGEMLLVVLPAPAFRVTMAVDYPAPIGAQFFASAVDPATYLEEIAPNRTFCFEYEIEALKRAGLAQGGSLENAVVFAKDGPMVPLRSANEPARHKALDVIGDFALLGARPQCEIVAVKSGHTLHNKAVVALRKTLRAAVAR